MTREIKFRGRTLNKKWVYGDLLHYTNIFASNEKNNGSIIVTDYKSESDNSFKIVIPQTVGQFTGLKDKNGKEIYGGDIIKDIKTDKVGYIAFLSQEMGYVIVWQESDTRLGHRNRGGGYDIDFTLEIIGNIYDNHELLKGDAE